MPFRFNLFWAALLSLIGARLFAMIGLPLMDTSEPRYAEIARTMLVSGDWITPWFAPDVPFWGKPPLSFWAQALAMKVFGINALAVRLPSLLATMLTLALLFRLANSLFGAATARLATLMCMSALVMFVDAGAVLTDPFLTLGVTLSLVAFLMAHIHPSAGWRYGFFVGLAVGLLAKGPLALVLVGFPVVVAWWLSGDWRTCWRALPWVTGLLLTMVLVVPWYAAAEIKTPGFLRYFLVGEHILRFIDPGWQGDLYGNGHARAHGTIWIYWLLGALPWSLWILPAIASFFRQRSSSGAVMSTSLPSRAVWAFLLAWAIVCGLLFSPASNILPTYVQPSLPALCLLLAHGIARSGEPRRFRQIEQVTVVLALVYAGVTGAALWQEDQLKSERSLVAAMPAQAVQDGALVFLGKPTYSASFYAQGRVQATDPAALAQRLWRDPSPVYVAIPQRRVQALLAGLSSPPQAVFSNPRYTLVVIEPGATRAPLITRLDPYWQKDVP